MKFHKWMIIVGLAIAAGVAWWYGKDYLSLEAVQAQRAEFSAYVENNYALALLGFAAIYVTSTALSLPFGLILTLLGGFLFGAIIGTLTIIVSATIGACIIFLIARSAFGESLRARAGGIYEKVEHEFQDNAVGYLLFLRLVPLFPFALVNILPALFRMDLSRYALATFFGIMPGTAVYAYAGQSLGTIEKLSDLASFEVTSAFILLGLMAMVPAGLKKWKERNNEGNKANAE